MKTINDVNFKEMLQNAVKEPGTVHDGYSMFYNYSLMNQFLIMSQGGNQPVATYKKWQKLGRQVKRGEKSGISICVPRQVVIKDDAGNVEKSFTKFTFQRCLFTFDQTEGDSELEAPETPNFDLKKVLKHFNIKKVKFSHHNGNIQGYATVNREIAVNPVAKFKLKTALHEIAHIIHGHTDLEAHDNTLPKDIKELEAEATAYLVLAALGKKSELKYCRGYIQNWFKGDDIPEKSAKRIMEKANKILDAGVK